MFIRDINKTTKLETYINNSFLLYKDDILILHSKQWKEEDISGQSCIQYKIYNYYLTIYYVILIYLEIKDGVNLEWNYYEEKYKLNKISKCLACNNINLNKILNIFGLPLTICTEDGGIECMGLQENFEIEPILFNTSNLYNKFDVKSLLNNPISCEILLSSSCNNINILNYILQINNNQEFLIL